ncbi:hypothetical protein J7E24_16450 [Hymenobacter sp. ISL-91]|uniref:hypothetical protein n=1 Tax=Hymenobacter sp. ISL-91 TaxID=2819151 RepID=UPI001BE61184|nr:hypothetical protein [Hymenobacter sp. ISL-91]MBT2559381.1 hypothetical protein [Hymenobacter sp. ISL-91]
MKNQFDLRLLNIGWLENMEEEQDLCAHGQVLARIGNTVVSDASGSSWTVSATALFLLRTLTLNHTPAAPVGDQLLPCCGFAMWPNPDDISGDVLVFGCPNGVDWSVENTAGGVILTPPEGAQVVITSQEYQHTVLQFVDEVHAFYQTSKPKELPTDPEDAAGYAAFWREWHRRYQQVGA